MGAPICERAAFCWNGIISVSHSLFFYCTELEDCVMHEYRASLCLTLHTNVDFPVRVSDSYLRDVVCFVQNRRSLFTTAVWSFYIISNVLSFCVSWLDGWNLLKIWTAKLCSHLLKSIQKCWWLFLNCLTSPQLVCGLLQTNLSCLNIVSVKFCCVSFSDWDVPKFTDSKFRFSNFSLKSLRTRTKLQSRAADRHQHTHTHTRALVCTDSARITLQIRCQETCNYKSSNLLPSRTCACVGVSFSYASLQLWKLH